MKTRYYNQTAVWPTVACAVVWALVLWPGLGRGAEPPEPVNPQPPQDVSEAQEVNSPPGAQAPQDVPPSQDRQEARDAAPPSAPEEPQTESSQDSWAKYQIILDRNIFSRQRGPIRSTEDVPERREVVIPNPESYFVLKGIVQEDGTFLAFIEDTRSSTVLRLRRGDAVAGGTIADLSLDEVKFQMNDRTIAVGLGQNLEGGLGSGAVTVDQLMEWSETGPSTSESTEAAPEPSATGAEADILKQLMERRKQQLGQ